MHIQIFRLGMIEIELDLKDQAYKSMARVVEGESRYLNENIETKTDSPAFSAQKTDFQRKKNLFNRFRFKKIEIVFVENSKNGKLTHAG